MIMTQNLFDHRHNIEMLHAHTLIFKLMSGISTKNAILTLRIVPRAYLLAQMGLVPQNMNFIPKNKILTSKRLFKCS
jgi:hypothetical protein